MRDSFLPQISNLAGVKQHDVEQVHDRSCGLQTVAFEKINEQVNSYTDSHTQITTGKHRVGHGGVQTRREQLLHRRNSAKSTEY